MGLVSAASRKRLAEGSIEEGDAVGVADAHGDGFQGERDVMARAVSNSMANLTNASAIESDVVDKELTEVAPHQSEEHYRLLFECNPIPMWVFDRGSLRFLAVNQAAVRQYGYTHQEFLAKTILEIRPKEDVSDVLADMSSHTLGLQERGFWRHRKKSGELIDVEIVCHPLNFQGIESILVSAYDMTARKRAELDLKDSDKKYRVLFEDSADATMLMGEHGFIDCNAAGLRMFGYSNEILTLHPGELSPRTQADGSCSRTASDAHMAAAFRNGQERFEWLHLRKNGEIFPAEVCLTALTLSGRPALLGTVRDISERKQAEEALSLKTALLEAQTESTIDGILVVDETDRVVLANKQFGLIFEIPEESLGNGDAFVLLKRVTAQVEDPESFVERVNYLASHLEEKATGRLKLKNGRIFDQYSAPLVDANGCRRGRIWYHRDITERTAAEERIQFLAYHDALTGLPHRALLQDQLEHALADARQKGEKIALVFLDLDRFKLINDSYGHSFGDLVLKEIARRLKECVGQGHTVARVGGDEFLILLRSVKDAADAGITAQRVMKMMNASFLTQGQSVSVSCSIGVSMFPEHGKDGETLISHADAAMYSAKEGGRNGVQFFTDELYAQAEERLNMDKKLHLALERDEFSLVYQPQMDIESGRITGLEALIRWQHPELGFIPPDKFIPVAESNGLILPIGQWVLRTACAQARRWQDDGLLALPVAVNVSAVQFREEGFCELIRKVLWETGLSPQYLELELTESLLLSNADVTLSVLQRLQDMGVRIAFGAKPRAEVVAIGCD